MEARGVGNADGVADEILTAEDGAHMHFENMMRRSYFSMMHRSTNEIDILMSKTFLRIVPGVLP